MVGSCLDRLRELPDASVDAVVTDPPYELGFMGKSWDSSGIAFNTDVWLECLRVLKPGGHLLAFGGSRTWHRIAVAVEDAGFQIRDSVAWLYGSGFPKSLDVSKAIDKRGGVIAGQSCFAGVLKKAKSQTSMSTSDLNEVLGRRTSNLWSHFVGVQPLLPTAEQYWKLKSVLPIPDEWDIQFLQEAEREVIGKKTSGIANKEESARHTIGASQSVQVDVTAPATEDAVKWQGWGTALKPAFEPVIVARKPLVGTVAANVLEFGTGALNIDGTRIGTEERTFDSKGIPPGGDFVGQPWSPEKNVVTVAGRWPSNVVLDEFTAGLVDEQSGMLKSGSKKPLTNKSSGGVYGHGRKFGNVNFFSASEGGASRFFYVAKASKRDRNEGLDALEEQRHSDREKDDGVGGDNPRNRTNAAKQNFHPTVKPTDLMRQLVRLVTPPSGVVLDPFTGSGSTGKAAILEGFEFIGCELTQEYLPIIEGRLNHAVATVKAEQDREQEKLF
jgi:DNA modification methylase